MDEKRRKKRLKEDLLNRREALHKIGGFSFAAATVLTSAGMMLTGCGSSSSGGGGDSWVNNTPTGDGSTRQTAMELSVGDADVFSLTQNDSEMWFKVAVTSTHSISTEVIIDVYSSYPDGSTALRVHRQENSGYEDELMDPCMQGDRMVVYIEDSSDNLFHIQFELLGGYSDAHIGFNLWDTANPSWDNAWNDWSDNPWNDWADNPWNDWADNPWNDWWNMPWGNWMQSW